MSFIRVFILLFLFIFKPVIAEDILPTISVTVSRTPIEVQHSSAAITIITAEQIAESKAVYVSELLQSVVGLNVSRSGGPGAQSQVRLRGGEANHVLVLIDGIEVNDPAGGSEFDFGLLSTDQIERIEVLRGAQSALWGADAASGVINIISKSATEGQQLQLRSTLGSRDHFQKAVSFSHAKDKFDIRLGADWLKTDGINAVTVGNEKDGYESVTLTLKSHYVFDNDAELGLVARYSDSDADNDPGNDIGVPTDGFSTISRESIYARAFVKWAVWDQRWQHQLEYAITDRDNDFEKDAGRSSSKGQKYKWMYQTTLKLPTDNAKIDRQSLTLAAERERENFSQVDAISWGMDPNQKQRTVNYGYVAEYQLGFLDNFNFSVSARLDDNDKFDDAKTYRLGLSYAQPHWGTRWHVAHATGVKNPTFTELFGWAPKSFIGNPNLKAEHTKDWEIGVSQKLFDDHLNVTLTLFQQRLKDEIASNEAYNGSINSDGESKRDGLELGLQGDLADNLRYGFSYTYLVSTEGVSGEDKTEVRRPKQQWNGVMNYAFLQDKANLHISVDYIGKQRDVDFNISKRVQLDDYTLVNLALTYELSPDYKLFARVKNLFDVSYTEVVDFADEGIAGYAGFEITL